MAGYFGSKQQELRLVIEGPTLNYKLFDPASTDSGLKWFKAISAENGIPILSNYQPSAGDLITYKTTNGLPPGLALDPISGVLSGTPTKTEYFNTGLYAELTRNGSAIKLRLLNPEMRVNSPWVSYLPTVVSTAESSKYAMPTTYLLLATDTISYEFHTRNIYTNDCQVPDRVAKPSDITLDSITGAMRPANNTKAVWCVPVALKVVRNGETHVSETMTRFEIR